MEEKERAAIIERFSRFESFGTRRILNEIPENERWYKCHTCGAMVDRTPCPDCGEPYLEIACPLDHYHCGHDIVSGHAYCPVCGEGTCPECGTHDIIQLSRVTGYMQDVSGWNAGKRQELKDRHRVII